MVLFPCHTGTSALVGAARVSPLLLHWHRAEAWQVILVGRCDRRCLLIRNWASDSSNLVIRYFEIPIEPSRRPYPHLEIS